MTDQAFHAIALRLTGLPPAAMLREASKISEEIEECFRRQWPKAPVAAGRSYAHARIAQAVRVAHAEWPADAPKPVFPAVGEDWRQGQRAPAPDTATEDDVIAADKLDRDQGLDEE